jgi:3-oxoacyl-[acyl-carrier-protein] synthase III
MNRVALQLLGSGEYIPGLRVDSSEFDRRWGKPAGWTQDQTGVVTRAFIAPGEDVVTMGAAAARAALGDAQVDPGSLDAIIAVGSVPAQAIPCTAAFVHRELGLGSSGVAAFDVNATCLGFLAALDMVAQGIATGRYRRVLLVASEVASAGLNGMIRRLLVFLEMAPAPSYSARRCAPALCFAPRGCRPSAKAPSIARSVRTAHGPTSGITRRPSREAASSK